MNTFLSVVNYSRAGINTWGGPIPTDGGSSHGTTGTMDNPTLNYSGAVLSFAICVARFSNL